LIQLNAPHENEPKQAQQAPGDTKAHAWTEISILCRLDRVLDVWLLPNRRYCVRHRDAMDCGLIYEPQRYLETSKKWQHRKARVAPLLSTNKKNCESHRVYQLEAPENVMKQSIETS
jgi:hypothetical protein